MKFLDLHPIKIPTDDPHSFLCFDLPVDDRYLIKIVVEGILHALPVEGNDDRFNHSFVYTCAIYNKTTGFYNKEQLGEINQKLKFIENPAFLFSITRFYNTEGISHAGISEQVYCMVLNGDCVVALVEYLRELFPDDAGDGE